MRFTIVAVYFMYKNKFAIYNDPKEVSAEAESNEEVIAAAPSGEDLASEAEPA